MVQPLAINVRYAYLAAADHVDVLALVPPPRVSVMLDWPLVTRDVRMFSMEVAVRAQFRKALLNAVATSVPVVLNMFAGNVARLIQFIQVCEKFVPALVLIKGNEVKLVQVCQAAKKFVPALVLISGKLVRLVQPLHAS
jgi:hypothetical protein